MVMEQSYS